MKNKKRRSMKKRNNTSRALLTEDVFVDREYAREQFWQRYDMVEKDKDSVQVIMYYGLGGMGKTRLLYQIEKEIEEKGCDIVWEHYDLNDGHDPVVVLRKMAKDMAQRYRFDFPLFSYAVYSYMIKCGESIEQPEVKSLLDDVPFLRQVFRLANVIPGVGVFSKPAEWIVDSIYKSIDEIKKRRAKRMIEMVNNASKEKLHSEIPFIFADELNENLRLRSNPVLVLLLDTYESMVNEMSDLGTPVENDLWLRDDNDGLLFRIDGLLCVLAGREEVKWGLKDPDWDDSLTQIQIDSLDDNYSKQLLAIHNVDSTIQDTIYEVTKGMPMYLEVCVDTYRNAKEKGEEIRPEMFEGKIEKLAKRLLTYMTDEEKDVLYLLSCLGSWDDDEFYMVNERLGRESVKTGAYKRVLNLTIVRMDKGKYSIHQTMREILIQYCDDAKLTVYTKGLYGCISSDDIISQQSYKYLSIIAKICGSPKHDKLKDCWRDVIANALGEYLDAFLLNQFIGVYVMWHVTVDDYKMRTLYLRYLLKSSNYDEALRFIETSGIADDDNHETLDFNLTASYYYYINGIDDRAVEIRKDVYTKMTRKYGMENRETIRAGLALAASLSRVGEYEEAVRIGNACRKWLNRNEERYDSMLSAAKNQLGDSYFRMGMFDKAMAIYDEVYEERKNWTGFKNNSTMIAYNHMADCLVNMGRCEKALEIYKQVREIRQQELCTRQNYEICLDGEIVESNDHPDTIIVDNNRAVCLIYMGSYEKAYALLKEVVAKREATLKENAPATMGSMENLAICEYYLDKEDDSKLHIDEVIKKLTAKLGYEHQETIIARYHKTLMSGDSAATEAIIESYKKMQPVNEYNLQCMRSRKFIGYFSLGRYYE